MDQRCSCLSYACGVARAHSRHYSRLACAPSAALHVGNVAISADPWHNKVEKQEHAENLDCHRALYDHFVVMSTTILVRRTWLQDLQAGNTPGLIILGT